MIYGRAINLILFFIIIFILACFSWKFANHTSMTDFPVFYRAACAVMEGKSVYDISALSNYSTPEPLKGSFIYSIPAAYLISPISFLPYYFAKSVFVFLAIISYATAIYFILKINKACGRVFYFNTITLSFLWCPFIADLWQAQLNSLIFLMVSASAFLVAKKRFLSCGALLALPSLIKLFPIAIAMILGLKNLRIFISCILIFAISLFVTNSLGWFLYIENIDRFSIMPIFSFLTEFGILYFLIYSFLISGISAYHVFSAREINSIDTIALSIPAVLLSMPLVEYYHLVLVAFPCVYILTSREKKFPSKFLAIISVLLINVSTFSKDRLMLTTLSLIIIWVTMLFEIRGASLLKKVKMATL